MSLDYEVKKIIEDILSVYHNFDEIDIDTPLTGLPLEIDPHEMVYIVLELMEKYNITFDINDFENYKFNTIRGIINAVKRHVVN